MKMLQLKTLRTLWLAVAGLLGLVTPALAGSWEITVDTEGAGTQYDWAYTRYNALPPGPGHLEAGASSSGPTKWGAGLIASTCTGDGAFINGHAHTGLTAHATLHWKRRNLEYGGGSDPNDNPPKVVWYVENATAWADAWRGHVYPFTTVDLTATVDNGGSLSGTRLKDAQETPETVEQTYGKTMYGRYLNSVKVAGDTVVLPSRTFSSNIKVPDCILGEGQFRTGANYSVETINVSISASIAHGTLLVNKPDYQEWDGIVKRDYKRNAVGDALEPFWSGAGVYTVTADSLFPNQQYQWSVAGPGQPYIPSPHTAAEALTYLPAGSTPTKNFTLDFGKSSDGFAKDSTVTAYVTGDNAQKVGPLKVLVHWSLPTHLVYAKVGETPDDGAPPDIDQLMSQVQHVHGKAVTTGAQLTELAYRGLYEMPAEQLMLHSGFAVLGMAGDVFSISGAGDDLVTVYRGTRRGSELETFDDTGVLLSEAAQQSYRSSTAATDAEKLNEAYQFAASKHQEAIDLWETEENYVQAHGEFGSELPRIFQIPRTMISVTTDPLVAADFAKGVSGGAPGRVLMAQISRSKLLPQTIPGAGEQEYLIRYMVRGFTDYSPPAP